MVLQTPGHTPDSLALYDEGEPWIFVGDTVYKRGKEMPWGEKQDAPIILGAHSHWGDYVASLNELHEFVESEQTFPAKAIRLSSRNSTPGKDVGSFVPDAMTFIKRIAVGDVPVIAELPGDEVAPSGTLGDEPLTY